MSQTENSSWGLSASKLKGLPHPSVGVLIISKHLAYAGREEFTFAMVEEEYLRFARTKLVGSGRTRWPLNVLKSVSRQDIDAPRELISGIRPSRSGCTASWLRVGQCQAAIRKS